MLNRMKRFSANHYKLESTEQIRMLYYRNTDHCNYHYSEKNIFVYTNWL